MKGGTEKRFRTRTGRLLKAAAAGGSGMILVGLARMAAGGERALSRGFLQPPPPAQAAGTLIKRLTGRRATRRHSRLLNIGMHGLYGPVGGLAYTAARSKLRPPLAALGLFAGVWGGRLAALPGLGLRKPFWCYSARENGIDAAYHAVYAIGVAASHGVARRLV